MRLKNMWKRFWTLDVHNHAGFTLVELIIVIAILAILSTGAIAGYSAYVESANKTTDEALAAEVRNVLIMAMYSGELTTGDYVVINLDEIAGYGNDNDPSANTIYNAMAAAYGNGWENSLKLKWNGWDNSAAIDGEMMQIVNESNFSTDNMNSLLSQVQVVVGSASEALEGMAPPEQVKEILEANGISVGDKLTADNATAAANALVYCVGNELAGLDFTDFDNMGDAENAFLMAWMENDGSNTEYLDYGTTKAVQYASIYALATYIDEQTNEAKDYTKQLEEKAGLTILNEAETILADIKATYPDLYNNYKDTESVTDATSFIAYMKGMNASKDSLLQNTDLMSKDYFVDGYIAEYIDNYINLSSVLATDGCSIAFIFNGEDILCMPLDWN